MFAEEHNPVARSSPARWWLLRESVPDASCASSSASSSGVVVPSSVQSSAVSSQPHLPVDETEDAEESDSGVIARFGPTLPHSQRLSPEETVTQDVPSS